MGCATSRARRSARRSAQGRGDAGMTSLAETQRRFLRDLYGAQALDPRAAVYRRNVLANLHDALAAAYPVVRRLVGEAFFREAARQFTQAHPSTSGDLHAFGSA